MERGYVGMARKNARRRFRNWSTARPEQLPVFSYRQDSALYKRIWITFGRVPA
jgi:hypothetical protein